MIGMWLLRSDLSVSVAFLPSRGTNSEILRHGDFVGRKLKNDFGLVIALSLRRTLCEPYFSFWLRRFCYPVNR